MSDAADKANNERDDNLGALAQDVAHPFDQTNGIVDGLDGNADDPEQVDQRTAGDQGETAVPFGAPAPSGGPLPVVVEDEHGDTERDEDKDYPESP